MTILKLVWRSRRADEPQCAHFPSDICSGIQEGEITGEKCAHRGASARQECHTLSLGRNKHGHNNSAPYKGTAAPGPIRGTLRQFCFLPKIHRDIGQKVGSAVNDTAGNGDSVVYFTPRNGDSAVYLSLRNGDSAM